MVLVDDRVLVEDRVIVGVSRSAPDSWPVLQLPGASLLPGLIDAHAHVLLRGSWNELELARQMVEKNPGHRAASAIQAMSIANRCCGLPRDRANPDRPRNRLPEDLRQRAL